MKFLLLVYLASAFCFCNVGALLTYYMDNYCNGTLDISYLDAVRLKLTHRSAYKSNMNCNLLITSMKSLDRFMLYFKDFDIESNMGCTHDWLEVHDGNSIYSPYVSGMDFG
ncbi:astacin-like metalloendopeptidase [Mercenaria mercenaria]|uniref:astacin-like metalloendopeptidase n=1 Tax=Mercenaria mercenaria TaxID=6596 RepID=UPI00234F6073|nr:astacin-like metalloendopeptidase [Mercenaria mercenaria]